MDGACPDWNPSRCDELYQGIVEGVLCRTTNCQMQIVGENQWKIDKKRRSPVLILLAVVGSGVFAKNFCLQQQQTRGVNLHPGKRLLFCSFHFFPI